MVIISIIRLNNLFSRENNMNINRKKNGMKLVVCDNNRKISHNTINRL